MGPSAEEIAAAAAAEERAARHRAALERQRQEAEQRKLEEQIATGLEKWRQVKAVNRQLQCVLVRKKNSSMALRNEIEELDSRIVRIREVELPARVDGATDLEEKAEWETQMGQNMKASMGRGLMEREELVEELAQVTAQLREIGARNRQRIKDMSAEVREMQVAVKELQRQIQIMEGGDANQMCASPSESELSIGGRPDPPADDGGTPRSRSPLQDNPRKRISPGTSVGAGGAHASGASGFGTNLSIEALRSLPGMDLQALLSPNGNGATKTTASENKR